MKSCNITLILNEVFAPTIFFTFNFLVTFKVNVTFSDFPCILKFIICLFECVVSMLMYYETPNDNVTGRVCFVDDFLGCIKICINVTHDFVFSSQHDLSINVRLEIPLIFFSPLLAQCVSICLSMWSNATQKSLHVFLCSSPRFIITKLHFKNHKFNLDLCRKQSTKYYLLVYSLWFGC